MSPTFSILIPTYKGALVISETIKCILSQTFQNFEIIVNDDCSNDNIEEILKGFNDSRIKYFKNTRNLGYPGNLEASRHYAGGKYIYLMGQDDLLASTALKDTFDAFESSPDVGAVTRPYFWFDKDVKKPVRIKKRLSSDSNTTLSIDSDKADIITMFSTLDQLSGLAYRKEFFKIPFNPDVFPCHVYPFADIFKTHTVVFLKDYEVAVRISTSQTRFLSSIYDPSPIYTWFKMFNTVFDGDRYKDFRNFMIKNFVAKNYVGLVQIRNFSTLKNTAREIYLLVKYRPINIVTLNFWFFSILCVFIPPTLLIKLADLFKAKIYSRVIHGMRFNYANY